MIYLIVRKNKVCHQYNDEQIAINNLGFGDILLRTEGVMFEKYDDGDWQEIENRY